jgi:general secretion pathway protein G
MSATRAIFAPADSSSPTSTTSPLLMTRTHFRLHVRTADFQSRQTRRRRSSGFTLLEILLVLTIIVVVGGLVGQSLIGAASDAKVDASKAQMQMIKKAIERYQITIGGVPESLEVLVTGPTDPKKKAKFRNPYMDEIPMDAWDNEFVYTTKGNTYELRSAGDDGQTNTDDDVVVDGGKES